MKDIPGYEGRYAVTTTGKVWSHLSSRWLKMRLTPDGYNRVSFGPNTYKIGYLVLITYVGPRPEGQQVRHGIRGTQCDHLDNLCWGSSKDQAADRRQHGTERQTWVQCVETGIIELCSTATYAAARSKGFSAGYRYRFASPPTQIKSVIGIDPTGRKHPFESMSQMARKLGCSLSGVRNAKNHNGTILGWKVIPIEREDNSFVEMFNMDTMVSKIQTPPATQYELFKGYSFDKNRGNWVASIKQNGKYYSKRCATKGEAIRWRERLSNWTKCEIERLQGTKGVRLEVAGGRRVRH